MKLLLLSMAMAVALAGCDRRVAQVDEEDSMAADSTVSPTGAAPIGQADSTVSTSPPAGPTDPRCVGLTGQDRIDCEAMPDTMADSMPEPMTDPVTDPQNPTDPMSPMNPVDPADPLDSTDPMDPANPVPTDTTDDGTTPP